MSAIQKHHEEKAQKAAPAAAPAATEPQGRAQAAPEEVTSGG